MMKEYEARNRTPGSVAGDFVEMDRRFKHSRDPQIAALNHSILAEDGAKFGLDHIDEVIVETELEGVDDVLCVPMSLFESEKTMGNSKEFRESTAA